MNNVEFFSLRRQHAELQEALDAATSRVMGRGQFILGPELERFEQDFAAHAGVKHAIGVGNGLEALVLILRALAVGPGDEVIVPGHTFIATWLAVEEVGARVVPVDVDPETFNIDPAAVDAAITPRTRAIIVVHLYGQPAEMDAVQRIAQHRGIAIIEDAAQAHGATYKGRKAGSLGLAAAFSFYPTKNLGALGDGGAVTTDHDAVAAAVRELRNYGSSAKYRHDSLGTNSRLDELQAGYLSAKLAVLDAKNAARRAVAARYSEELGNLPGLTLPVQSAGAQSVWHLYVVRVSWRDEVQRYLSSRGIGTMVHYPTPPHLQPAYASSALAKLRLPHTERIAGEVLSLPMWPELTDSEVDRVIDAMRNAVAAVAAVAGAHSAVS